MSAFIRSEYALYVAGLALLFLALGASISAAFFGGRSSVFGRMSAAAGLASLGSFVLSALARTLGARRLPFASMYEFGLLMVIAVLAIWAVVDLRSDGLIYRSILLPLALALSGVMLLFFQESRPLMPALQSAWLAAHVIVAVLSYGFFAAGAALAAAWLILSRRRAVPGGSSGPDGDGLWRNMDRLTSLGFPFLTLLILSGAVWAQYAWGSFWRWDPKETWSLITWLIYLAYLHGKRVMRRSPAWCAWFSLLGFAAVLFTFFGVNLLLSGLHSYR